MQKSTAARVPCGAVRCSTSSLELLRAQPRTTDDDKVFAAQRGTRQPHRLTAARRRRRSESATFYATATLPISPWITSRPFAISTGPLLEPDTSVSREFFNQGERPRGLRPRPHEPGRTRRVRRRPLTPLPPTKQPATLGVAGCFVHADTALLCQIAVAVARTAETPAHPSSVRCPRPVCRPRIVVVYLKMIPDDIPSPQNDDFAKVSENGSDLS